MRHWRAALLVCIALGILVGWLVVRSRSTAQRAAAGARATGQPARGARAESVTTRAVPLVLPGATVRHDEPAAAGAFGGWVRSSVDGQPIARAALSFLHGSAGGALALSAETDENGRFLVTPPAVGAWELASAAADGFVPFTPTLGHSPLVVWARAGVRFDELTVYLTPAVALTVSVRDGAGKPIAGAAVRAFAATEGPAEARPVVTDARGEARLAVAAYDLVEARKSGFAPARSWVDDATVTTRQLSLTMTPGDDRAPSTIVGRVIDRAGQPVDGARVEATPSAGSDGEEASGAQALTGSDGSFTLAGLAPGSYVVSASARGQGSARRRGVAAGSAGLELRLGAPDAAIRGRVRDAGGQPVTAFTVVAWVQRGALGRGPESRASVVDADGRYELPLPPDSYVVAAAARGYAPSTEERVVLSDGPEVRDFTLSRGGRLFGRVVERGSGAPLAGARVVLEGDVMGDGVTLSSEVASGADGSFAIAGLGAGRHALDVQADGHDGRIVSGLSLDAEGALGPINIDLAKVEPGERPKTELVGIGAVLAADESGAHLMVRAVMPGGGAAEVGLRAGDIILAIDGKAVTEVGFSPAVQLIRGPEGSVVVLIVERADGSSSVVPVPRRRITN